MTTPAQRRALAAHRRRTAESGLVRVEVRVPSEKAQVIRDVAATMRMDPNATVQVVPGAAGPTGHGRSLWDVMQALPYVSGPEFDEAFDRPKERWAFREIDLCDS